MIKLHSVRNLLRIYIISSANCITIIIFEPGETGLIGFSGMPVAQCQPDVNGANGVLVRREGTPGPQGPT